MKNIHPEKPHQNYNSLIIELLGEKPIAFNPMLAQIAKSALAGLFLSQLLYWWKKGSDPDWVYKTIKEVQQETFMTRSEQDRAIKIWKNLGVIKVELRNIPRRRYFHIHKDRFIFLLENTSGKQLSQRANQYAESCKQESKQQQTNYTESTQEKRNVEEIKSKTRELVNKFRSTDFHSNSP